MFINKRFTRILISVGLIKGWEWELRMGGHPGVAGVEVVKTTEEEGAMV